MHKEVASPIDLRNIKDAQAWADTVMLKRPYRTLFFEQFAKCIADINISQPLILELGSGPGFLAKYLLERITFENYAALDFSPAMHQLASIRLGSLSQQVQFIERDFKQSNWSDQLGLFDVIVSMQAVHELRHKDLTVALFKQVKALLKPQGQFLVCDHYAGFDQHGAMAMQNNELYMTPDEQFSALKAAGFSQVKPILQHGTLLLHAAQH